MTFAMQHLPPPFRIPCASYRLQLQPGFGFAEAAAAVPYLAALGITECYVSPIWRARPGSRHGYDVCDPNALNEELGTRRDFDTFVSALRAHDMGLVLDIVPNHMAADEHANLWWRDVLRQGQGSPSAQLFDINWHPLKHELEGKVLLPVLGVGYGEALESGQLRAAIVDDEPALTYGDRNFPLNVPPGVDVASLNGTVGHAASFDRLHGVLERQAYRLAAWRTAASELNYRRFFNIDHLIGLRMEDAEVFRATHTLLAELLDAGAVTGLRIDHPDGLAVPDEYFRRLQEMSRRSAPHALASIYVVVEKILVPGEHLEPSWEVHGTTGYEFLNVVNGMFVARERARALTAVYTRFAGRAPEFADTAYAAKKQVMDTTFATDVDRLAHSLNDLSERDRRSRDLTLYALRRALVEIVACLGIYRTYVNANGCSAADRHHIIAAAEEADRRVPAVDGSAFAFVRDVLLQASALRPEHLRVALRIQQLTGAVFAKAVEDTAFYRDNTLVSLNEVGGDPAQKGVPVATLHRLNEYRLARTPLAMATTSTHDTKLGEDARARLNVLTERPRDWQLRIGSWSRANRHRRSRVGTTWAPARNDEYRFYQALVAIWPAASGPATAVADADLVARLTSYAIKSAREANRHTSWVRENARYEEGLTRFVRDALSAPGAEPFLASVADFVAEVALPGALNGLSQTLIKITSPGVPDFYQGTELWQHHLVDPDNRGIVDMSDRASRLGVLTDAMTRDGRAATAAHLLETWPDGMLKLFVTSEALRYRRDHRGLFLEGAYDALAVDTRGLAADAVAFARHHGDRHVVVVTPRLTARVPDAAQWPLATRWREASVAAPQALSGLTLRNVLTGDTCTVGRDGRLSLADVFARFPVAMLEPVDAV